MTVRTTESTQEGVYQAEHWGAWLTMLVALLLGAIGVVRGFGLIGGGVDAGGVATGAPGTVAPGFQAIWDSAVWLLAAIAIGLLSLALHRNEHHRSRDPELARDADEGLWKGEHAFAWLMALLTIAATTLGVLVSFDLLKRGNDQPDGLPWLLFGILCGVVTNTLHAVRHHSLATDEEYLVRLVERRVSAPEGVRVTGQPGEIRGDVRR